MSAQPFGSVSDDSLVDETPIDTGQPHLVFTREELQKMSNTMIRRLASEFDSDSVNGKSPRFVIESALACQTDLSRYDE